MTHDAEGWHDAEGRLGPDFPKRQPLSQRSVEARTSRSEHLLRTVHDELESMTALVERALLRCLAFQRNDVNTADAGVERDAHHLHASLSAVSAQLGDTHRTFERLASRRRSRDASRATSSVSDGPALERSFLPNENGHSCTSDAEPGKPPWPADAEARLAHAIRLGGVAVPLLCIAFGILAIGRSVV